MTDVSQKKLDHLGFIRVEPSVPFKAYIDSYWFINATCTTQQGYQEFLHPDGGMGFIFNYGNALSFNGQKDQTHASLDGINTKSVGLVLTENINAVGIRFKPAGASVFLDMPLHEMKDQRLGLPDLNSISFSDLYHRIPEQKSLRDKVSIIETTLSQTRRQNKTISTQSTQAIKHVKESQGRLTIKTLSQDLDINQRKLERLFKAQLGMSASEYTRIVRIEQARTSLKKTNCSLAEVAYELGFYDQAHFSKSFQSVVGISPGQYRANGKR